MARTKHDLPPLISAGISPADAKALRSISRTLHTWHEAECNGVLQRDEKTQKPYWYNPETGRCMGRAIDREKGALERLALIMARYPTLSAYIQGDPRGASLYILRPGDVPEGKPASSYYSNGIAA